MATGPADYGPAVAVVHPPLPGLAAPAMSPALPEHLQSVRAAVLAKAESPRPRLASRVVGGMPLASELYLYRPSKKRRSIANARKKNRNPNQEIEEYRDLMQVPDRFENGFTIKAVLGVLFVSFIMVPGNMYLSLMIGGSLGAAAEWVTIILFAEITKRSFSSLRRQEVYVLFYVAASLIAAETGAFEGLLYNSTWCNRQPPSSSASPS